MKIPPIGMRIIKSAAAVMLCYLVSFLRQGSGIVFYSQLAALWCIQVYVANTKQNAAQRLSGTTIGALYGLLYLLVRNRIWKNAGIYEIVDALVISGMIVVILYTTVLIHKKQASYFSCVVFLSIVVNHVGDVNPYLFVWNRFLDTVIGILIGVGVNIFSLPKVKRRDILFISGLDDTLLTKGDALSDYSKVELNRMLDEGANFTISTIRTPASLMEPVRDIRLRLPVIAMDGAVLYDIREKQYLKVYVISYHRARQVLELIRGQGLSCFTNVIVDDMLVIYYEETEDLQHKQIIQELRRSPYRNYVKRGLPEGEDVVYFWMTYPTPVIEEFYHVLEKEGITKDLKVVKYLSEKQQGYSGIKIYNKNAAKENMIQYLKEMIQVEKTVTFGSVPNRYDVIVRPGDTNKVVHILKKQYEPLWFRKRDSM